MTDSNKPEKSGLSKALARTENNNTGSNGGLGGALAKRDGKTPAVVSPKTADVSALKNAYDKSQETAQRIAEANARELANSCGIAFVVDATASREANWREAQSIQANMFDALGNLEGKKIGIICHRGGSVENLGWFKSGDSAKSSMRDISCVGGHTRVCTSLENALQGTDGKKPSAIVLVGDYFEEEMSDLYRIAARLKEKKVPVYAFIEGGDPDGNKAFQYVAETTGGVCKKFGQGLELRDLYVAAVVLSTQGKAAFDKLLQSGHKGALALDSGMPERKQLGTGNTPRP